MRNNKLIIASFICLVICYCVSPVLGQTNYRKGYYISLEGDTVHGEINVRVADSNSKTCVFRSGPAAKLQKFSPEEIAGYVIEDKMFFQTYVVKNSDSEYKRFFLKVVDSELALLALPDQTLGLFPKSDFFLFEKSSEHLFPLKPMREIVNIESKNYQTTEVYARGMLRANMQSQRESLYSFIESEPNIYNEKVLSGLVTEYNRLEGNDYETYERVKTPLHITLDAHVTVDFQSADIRFNDIYKFEFSSSPVINYGLSAGIFVPRLSEKVRITTGFLYSSQELNSTLVIEDEVNDFTMSYGRLQGVFGLRLMKITSAKLTFEVDFVHSRYLNSSYDWERRTLVNGVETMTTVDAYSSAIGESGNGFAVSFGKDFSIFDERKLNISFTYSSMNEKLDRAKWSSVGGSLRFNIIK